MRALEAAIERLGHRAVRLGAPHALLAAIGKGELPALDAALSIAEGYGGRNREAWAPVLLEMAGVPCARLGRARRCRSRSTRRWRAPVVAAAGVPVAARLRARPGRRSGKRRDSGRPWPLFVKPRWEGTAKGIGAELAGRGPRGARARGRAHRARLPPARAGRGVPARRRVHGERGGPSAARAARAAARARARARASASTRSSATRRRAGGWRARHARRARRRARGASSAALALRAFDALECRDFARADFRLDAAGRPRFLEMNPLPTFAADGSFGDPGRARGPPARGAARRRDRRRRCARLGLARARRVAARARPPEWSDWTWQMQHRIRSAAQLREWLEPTPDERAGIEKLAERFHFVITPYYASLMDPHDPGLSDPPPGGAAAPPSSHDPAGLADPLDEVAHSPVKNVIRVYARPHRLLRQQRVRALLPLLPAQAHGGRARVGDEEARARGGARLDPRARRRSATCC